MIIKGLMAWSGFYGGTIGNMLSQWEQAGVFSYALPFLIIFALVYTILTNVSVFKNNKAVNAVISLAVGFMSLQFEFVPRFFSEVFPNLGIGLIVILVIVIMIGLFTDLSDKHIRTVLGIVGAIIAIIVLYNTDSFGWSSGWQEGIWDWIWILLGLGAIVVVVASVGGEGKDKGILARLGGKD